MFPLDEMSTGEASALLKYANKITGHADKTEDELTLETPASQQALRQEIRARSFAMHGTPAKQKPTAPKSSGDTFVMRKVKEAADNFAALDAPALETKK
jgi:hypothetical protein